MKYTEESEPPHNYHVWTGMSVLAGALQRRVYVKWGKSTIYPNLYIILLGPSGWAKKGTALEFGRTMLTEVGGLHVVEGATTREKLIRNIGNSMKPIVDGKTGMTVQQCAITYLSAEWAVFMGQHNTKLLADLCDWYDSPQEWKYDTKGQGTDTINGVCLNMLGGVAPDWIPTIMPTQAIGGGFTSRCIWVVEEMKGKTVKRPRFDEDLEKTLINDLQHIQLLSGEFVMTEDALSFYDEWYEQSDKDYIAGKPVIADPNFAGYLARRATLIKKLGMILSASEGHSLQITSKHLQRALFLLEPVEAKMPKAFAGLGMARYAYALELIFNFIVLRKVVTRTQILRFHYRNVDVETYQIVIGTLKAMDMINITYKPDENEEIIRLVDEDERRATLYERAALDETKLLVEGGKENEKT